MHKSNESLLSFALRKGDKELLLETYEKIYNDYVKLVSFSVSKYINDNEMIKDITNDVFVSFFNNCEKVSNSIKYYLMVITKNMCLQYLEKNNKLVNYENINEIGYLDNFESHINYLELVEDLKKELDEREVNIILWHVIDGYTFKEIGKHLNLNHKNVNKIYERAIKKYRSRKENI